MCGLVCWCSLGLKVDLWIEWGIMGSGGCCINSIIKIGQIMTNVVFWAQC